jgi:hypothetical protein
MVLGISFKYRNTIVIILNLAKKYVTQCNSSKRNTQTLLAKGQSLLHGCPIEYLNGPTPPVVVTV